jgi:hypothetical protein
MSRRSTEFADYADFEEGCERQISNELLAH